MSKKREVNTVLADIIKHMTPDRAFEDAYPQVRGSSPNACCCLQTQNSPWKTCFCCSAAAVGDQEDPHLLPQLLCPLLNGERLRTPLTSGDLEPSATQAVSSTCRLCFPGAFPALPGHVPEGRREGGGLQSYHGGLHKVGTLRNASRKES